MLVIACLIGWPEMPLVRRVELKLTMAWSYEEQRTVSTTSRTPTKGVDFSREEEPPVGVGEER